MKPIFKSFLVFTFILISFNGFSQTALMKKYERAIFLYQTEQLVKLSALADTLIEQDKENPTPYFFKAYALDLEKSRPIQEEKLYQEIENLYSKAISISNKTHFLSYFYRGFLYESNFKYTESLEDYNSALELANQPDMIIAVLLNRSGIYLLSLETEKAMADLKLILDYDKNHTDAMINIGMIYLGNTDFEKARKSFEHVLELEPENLTALNNMGYTLSELEDYKGCIKYNNKVIKLEPGYDAAYNNRGFAKFKLGKVKEGIEDIEKCIELNPTNSFAYRNLAEIYKEQKDYKKACEYVEKAKKHGFLIEYEGRIKSLNALCIK